MIIRNLNQVHKIEAHCKNMSVNVGMVLNGGCDQERDKWHGEALGAIRNL